MNQIPQNLGIYPGCGYPIFVEDHSNPEAEKFRAKLNDEIMCKQALAKVEFLENMLKDSHIQLTKPQLNVLNAELNDAKRQFATLSQQMNNKYGTNAQP